MKCEPYADAGTDEERVESIRLAYRQFQIDGDASILAQLVGQVLGEKPDTVYELRYVGGVRASYGLFNTRAEAEAACNRKATLHPNLLGGLEIVERPRGWNAYEHYALKGKP